jgi:hypothetical protein
LLLLTQPVDPLDLWASPPFEAQLQQIDGQSYFVGRGIDDDKGETDCERPTATTSHSNTAEEQCLLFVCIKSLSLILSS